MLMRANAAVLLLSVLALSRPVTAGVIVTPVATDPLLSGAVGLTTDGINLYATTQPPSGSGRVVSVPLVGGSVTSLYSSVSPYGIATVGANLFWIDPNSGPITDTQILSAPKGGGGPVNAIYTGAVVGEPIVDGSGLTTDGTRLYSADEVQGQVHRLNLDGSQLTQLGGDRYGGFFNTEHLNTIAASGGLLYIADSGRSGVIAPQVVSISTSGGAFTTLFAGSPFIQPTGIAVGGGSIFVADGGANVIWSLPITGGTPTLFASDARFQRLNQMTYHDGALYVADSGASTIWKVSSSAVPEPSSLVSAALGLAALAGYAGWRRPRPRRAS